MLEHNAKEKGVNISPKQTNIWQVQEYSTPRLEDG